jgi:hypothetical protein
MGLVFTVRAAPASFWAPDEWAYLTDYKPDVNWQSACKTFSRTGDMAGLNRERTVRYAMTAWLVIALLLIGVSIGRAFDTDEAIITVDVSSADHELQEGYFALGDQATVMAKPGSDLFRFLSRQRGNKVKIVLTRSDARELSRLQR